MRPRPKRRPAAEAGGLPLCLRAGRCIEVWAPGEPEAPLLAFRRWGAARARWLDEAGIGPADYQSQPPEIRAHSPWSFVFLARERPADLAKKLAARGLPADWRPAESIDEAQEWIARSVR